MVKHSYFSVVRTIKLRNPGFYQIVYAIGLYGKQLVV